MQSSRLLSSLAFLAAAPLVAVPAVSAQQAPAAAPIPAPILSAHTVFLANGGADRASIESFKKAGQVNEPYASVYAALESWGHWQLVPSPEAADLILTVRFTAPVDGYSKGVPFYEPQLDLTLTDTKTHTQLWVLTQPVDSALRKATWDKNYAEGVAGLITQLKTLTTSAAP
ncbi:MAG: hypothetical protein WA414_06850 [Acidobacteriaceae bacterium]